MAWADFLRGWPRAHGVQLYGDYAEFADSAAEYLAGGFGAGEPAVVIATRAHGSAILDALDARGWNASQITHEGLLVFKEADDVLAAFMVAGRPSARLFERVVGTLLDELAATSANGRVRAVGEMVDILCQRGENEAAAELEDLWNAAARTREFSLLCGYQLDVFDRTTQLETLSHVCTSHTHIRPAADEERLARAVDRALEEVLGADEAGKVYLLLGEELRQARVPMPQLVLQWVSSNMPVLADRVLASAREHYAAAPATAG